MVNCLNANTCTLHPAPHALLPKSDDVFPRGEFKMRDLVTLLPMLDEMSILSLTGPAPTLRPLPCSYMHATTCNPRHPQTSLPIAH